MRIELEYRGEDNRWHWRVYPKGQPLNVVREGFSRSSSEAENAARLAALEYEARVEL